MLSTPPPVIVVSNRRTLFACDTEAKARRDAHRWLRCPSAQDGEWVTILDAVTGAVRKRYQRRNGSVQRMQ